MAIKFKEPTEIQKLRWENKSYSRRCYNCKSAFETNDSNQWDCDVCEKLDRTL